MVSTEGEDDWKKVDAFPSYLPELWAKKLLEELDRELLFKGAIS
jgi:hypothetical protein